MSRSSNDEYRMMNDEVSGSQEKAIRWRLAVGSWVVGKPQRGDNFVAPDFNPVFKDVIVHQRWPKSIIRKRRLSASKIEMDS